MVDCSLQLIIFFLKVTSTYGHRRILCSGCTKHIDHYDAIPLRICFLFVHPSPTLSFSLSFSQKNVELIHTKVLNGSSLCEFFKISTNTEY